MKAFLTFASGLIILSLFAISAKAQNKDYVVTTKGDTIPCRVKHSLLGASTKYRTADTGDWKKINIDSIKAYSMSAKGILYRKVSVPNDDNTFMRVVEDGKICLYEKDITRYYANGTTSTTVLWYVTKGSIIHELKTSDLINGFSKSKQERRLDFASMLTDKKAVYDLFIKDNAFSFDELRNIVHLYNTGKPFIQPDTNKEDRSGDFNPNQN